MSDRLNRLLAGAATAVGAAVAVTTGSVAAFAWAKGRSVRSQALFALLGASRRRKKFASAKALQAAIAVNRKAGPAKPPESLRSRCKVTEGRHSGSLVYTVAPADGVPSGTILYIHGGAYVFDLVSAHWTIIEALVNQTRAEVVVPVYPLAPEANYQRGQAFVRELWARLSTRGEPVALAGDSAGGGLALAFAQSLRKSDAQPVALLLLSPWVDVTVGSSSQPVIERRDPMLLIEGLRDAGKMWAGETSPSDPRISPINGEIDNLPPIAIFTGTDDILNADARRLRDKLVSANKSVAFHEYPRMFHVWMGAPIPEGRKALSQASAFLRNKLGDKPTAA